MWKLLNLFRRNPGRELRQLQIDRDRAKVRARVDEMRANMGLEPARWR